MQWFVLHVINLAPAFAAARLKIIPRAQLMKVQFSLSASLSSWAYS